jgi:hypothetical protein
LPTDDPDPDFKQRIRYCERQRPRGTKCPRFCIIIVPPEEQGRRECRLHNAPAALRASEESTQSKSPQVRRMIRADSLHNGFTAYGAPSPVSGLFSHRRPKIIPRDLIPASGDQDHASLPYASAALV